MLGALVNPLTKGLLFVASIAIVTAILTTNLYLSTRDELTALKSKHTQLKQEYTECSEGKDRVVEGAQQDDMLNVEKEEKLSALEDEKEALLKRLKDLSKTKKCLAIPLPTQTANTLEAPQNEIINPHASWDADIQQLLNEAYENNKRDTNPTP